MNLNKNRPKDEEILELIEKGVPQKQICEQLGTHSQRIQKLKGKVRKFGDGIVSHFNFSEPKLYDNFFENAF